MVEGTIGKEQCTLEGGSASSSALFHQREIQQPNSKSMFNSLIQEHHVDLVLQGHEHSYGRMTGHDENSNPTTPVYTVSHCSPKIYRIYFGEDFDKFGIDGKYYQQIQVKGDTLLMNSFDAANGDLYDCIKIVKKITRQKS